MFPLTIYSQYDSQSHPFSTWIRLLICSKPFHGTHFSRNKFTMSHIIWPHFVVSPLCFFIDLLSAGLLAGPQQARAIPSCAVVRTSSPAQNDHLPGICLSNSPCLSNLCSNLSSQRSLQWPLYFNLQHPPPPPPPLCHHRHLLSLLFCSTFCFSKHVLLSLFRSFTFFLSVSFNVGPSH